MNQWRTCAFALAALLLTGAWPPARQAARRWCGVPVRVELEKPYSDRGVREMPARYTHARGHHRLDQPAHASHVLFTWLKAQGIERRAHPALQRSCHPTVPGDLLPPRPRRRPAASSHDRQARVGGHGQRDVTQRS